MVILISRWKMHVTARSECFSHSASDDDGRTVVSYAQAIGTFAGDVRLFSVTSP
jgi:hypothetical protein